MESNIFEAASRQKVRFDTPKGSLSVEDLWALPLTSLDTIARTLNRKLKDEADESYISPRSKGNTDDQLKFDLVKHVIDVRLAEAADVKEKKDKLAQIATLEGLLEKKHLEELGSLSAADIAKKIAELKG